VGAGLNIYFVAIARRGVEGLILAQVLLAALQAFVCLLMLRDLIKPDFSKPVLRSLLNFGLPLVPGAIAALILVSADRYILNKFSTTTMVGLYSLGYSIGMVINLIVQAVQLAWPTQLFEIAKLPDAKQRLSMTLTYYCLALGFISLAVSVLAREILAIMTTPEYYGAYIIMPLITLSYVFYGIRFMTTIGMYIKNKVKYSSFVIISAAIFNLLLSFILIPRFGMIGAAWATFISYFLLAVVNIMVDSRFMRIPYEYWRLVKILVIWFVVYGISLLINTPSIWINLILNSMLLLGYPIFLFVIRFYNQQEIHFMKDALLRRAFHRSAPS
jgi:O-antigen/teichoic acid export membrane protein